MNIEYCHGSQMSTEVHVLHITQET